MKKLRPIFVFALIVFSPFTKSIAQTLTVPANACPATTVTATFSPASGATNCAVNFNVIGPGTAYDKVTNNATNTFTFKLPEVNSTAPFKVIADYACTATSGSVGNIQKDITLSTVKFSNSHIMNVDCGATTFTITYPVNKSEAGNATWSVLNNTPGWNTSFTPTKSQQPDGSWKYVSVWTIPASGEATIRLSITNPTCPNVGNSVADFQIKRAANNAMKAATFTAAQRQICANTTSTFAIAAYPDATQYVWSSSDPSIKINGQTTPVTLPASSGTSVSISVGNQNMEGWVGVVALTPCGKSLLATAGFFAGTPYIEMLGFTNSKGTEGYFCSNWTGNVLEVYPYFHTVEYEARLRTLTGTTLQTVPTLYEGTPDVFGFRPKGFYLAGVRIKNSTCGSQDWFETELEAKECTGSGSDEPGQFRVNATPNPTTSALVVTTSEEKDEVKKLSTATDVQYTLYDFYTGAAVKRWNYKNDQTVQTLQVQGLKPGPYVLQVVKGKYTSSKTIIIR